MFLETPSLDTNQQGSLHMCQGFFSDMFLVYSLLTNRIIHRGLYKSKSCYYWIYKCKNASWGWAKFAPKLWRTWSFPVTARLYLFRKNINKNKQKTRNIFWSGAIIRVIGYLNIPVMVLVLFSANCAISCDTRAQFLRGHCAKDTQIKSRQKLPP